ncbi:hypothetical protein FV232_17175 [Methylobacterium sp. WL30]|uniref:hypothetical protein n=1 Tax=unclassified Methylobacterium TaxID=2615210 RepID=UPI0011C7BCB8|nr:MULTISPECIES: hypothetical protein [unclassified Methylobacterium]TXN41713.1 hypothetical protein FV225_01595 [Methylobacterium sp. WL93]TXN51049.1 hypothetical protein FV227_09555 [Methylobacterium sp. WL119]TXN65823.1 hypothetical protein FV232_17175 [Methylobacterium sp. WL30]TXN75110.1 hypothetical protein FV228_04430 [Methylobacterium sp. WL18]
MKLSEVTLANDLVKRRRDWVTAYVDIGRETSIGPGNSYGPFGGALTLFGYRFDDKMVEAVRRAMRAELRTRIADLDQELAALGVEVDGIEITIASEEAKCPPQRVEEAA